MTSGRQLPARTALLAVGAAVLLLSGCAAWRIGQAVEMARVSEPLQQSPDKPSLRLLVVGDSTAVGTGASSASTSLAGLIAQQHPTWQIQNRSRDGAKFGDVLNQLDGQDRFDIVLVQAGGNDVIRLVDLDALNVTIDQVAAAAKERADKVVLMPAGNVGNAPFFFAPVSWWMTSRSRQMHAFVRKAAERHGATYVRLFQEREDDPFVLNPGLHARDGLLSNASMRGCLILEASRHCSRRAGPIRAHSSAKNFV